MTVCVDNMDTLLQAKHMILLKDTIVQDIIRFLEQCEGKMTLYMYIYHSYTMYCVH